MTILVDSSVWSLAFRRASGSLGPEDARLVDELRNLVRSGRAVMLGVVRQETLSGIRDTTKFEKLREDLRSFDDCELALEDYETAALAFNTCRAHGVSGSVVDMLICGVAMRRGWSIFSSDPDFRNYAKWLPLQLHESG